MKITALINCWNSKLWIEYKLREIYPLVSTILIDEVNYTSLEDGWAGATSPDGTADLIRNFPDPDRKIKFRQLGHFPHGVLAARAELCSRIPPCDWVWIQDVDEFSRPKFLSWVKHRLGELPPTVTCVTQRVKSFYFDFTHHTTEEFTRLHRFYRGINPWQGRPPMPARAARFEKDADIFHYSYVPLPGVRIKGAQSFDVPLSKYQAWYRDVLSAYDGTNLDALYTQNGGGIHVFGGLPLTRYRGPHPAVLDDHPYRWLTYTKEGYVDPQGEIVTVPGWWTK